MISRLKFKTTEQISVTSRFSAVALTLTVALLMMPNISHADATPDCNTGLGSLSTECGISASAAGFHSTALGVSASAADVDSTAVGFEASAAGFGSTALGRGASADADFFSTAVGTLASAAGEASTALGTFASAAGKTSTAVGSNALADGENAIAIGSLSKANAPGAIALGANVVADVANTMVVGTPIRIIRDDGISQLRVIEKIAGNSVKTLFNLICDTCTPGFRFNQKLPSNNTWFFRMLQSGNFGIDDPATMTKEAEFRSGGDLKIGGTLIQASSRAIKTDIKALQGEDVLAKLEQLDISEWSYKKDQGKVKHIGPMAEDFHELFNVGIDNRSISSIDTSGVALAAIKALKSENEKLKYEKDTEIAQLQSQIDELKRLLTNSVVLNQSEQVANTITN